MASRGLCRSNPIDSYTLESREGLGRNIRDNGIGHSSDYSHWKTSMVEEKADKRSIDTGMVFQKDTGSCTDFILR